MEIDIVPDLLKVIDNEFDTQSFKSKKLKNAIQKLNEKKATYLDANDFAIEVGQILANVFQMNLTSEILPEGKMYFNIADRLLNSTMKKNYELISSFAMDVQKELNRVGKIGLTAQKPQLNQDRIVGIINRLVQAEKFDDIKWILNEPIINFSQSIIDDAIKANAGFQAKAGLRPKIKRQVVGKACDWCRNLAGTYDYYDAPDDIYRRHERCRCTVDYIPGEGKKQNVWTKVWVDHKKDEKIAKRKLLHLKNGGK